MNSPWYEFIEDDILIDSNNQNEFECMETLRAAKYLDSEILDGRNSEEKENINTIIPDQCSQKNSNNKNS